MDCIFLTGSSLRNGEGELEAGSPGVVLLSVTKEHDRHKAGVWDLTLTFHRDQIRLSAVICSRPNGGSVQSGFQRRAQGQLAGCLGPVH